MRKTFFPLPWLVVLCAGLYLGFCALPQGLTAAVDTALAAPRDAGKATPADPANPAGPATRKDGWVTMPAGGKPAFMGIHGGTVPVSLLVADDGNALVTFVGRTGNDFLEMLRRSDPPLPSLINAAARHNATHATGRDGVTLWAGSSQNSMPVIYLTGEGFARVTPFPHELRPFGFSAKALSIEGQAVKPSQPSPAKQYRLVFQPHYFQPRR